MTEAQFIIVRYNFKRFQTQSVSPVSLHLVQVCGKDHILHDEDVIQIVKLTSALAQATPCPDVIRAVRTRCFGNLFDIKSSQMISSVQCLDVLGVAM